MEKQLSIFGQTRKERHRGNPYRDIHGRYCSRQEAEITEREKELRKMARKAEYMERQARMYERMALALSKRLTSEKR